MKAESLGGNCTSNPCHEPGEVDPRWRILIYDNFTIFLGVLVTD